MTDDDEELWDLVTKDVQAYEKTKVIAADESADKNKRPDNISQGKPLKQIDKIQSPVIERVQPDRHNPGIDRRTAERLRKGQVPIEGRLDLHGFNQVEAEAAVMRFIQSAAAQGLRCVLIITGKGVGADGRRDPLERGQGVLRQKLPEWLGDARVSGYILKTASARPQHGGSGARYILLRRRRR